MMIRDFWWWRIDKISSRPLRTKADERRNARLWLVALGVGLVWMLGLAGFLVWVLWCVFCKIRRT